jgi:hypothetical protein
MTPTPVLIYVAFGMVVICAALFVAEILAMRRNRKGGRR